MFYVPSLSYKTIIYKGMLRRAQLGPVFSRPVQPAESALALVHSRFLHQHLSQLGPALRTATLPTTAKSTPCAATVNWMHARESMLASDLFGADIKKILPIIDESGSDSAMFDNVPGDARPHRPQLAPRRS